MKVESYHKRFPKSIFSTCNIIEIPIKDQKNPSKNKNGSKDLHQKYKQE